MDPDNKYDRGAIRVEMEGLGKIDCVANSTYTVLGECFSAGRLYDKIGDKAVARVKYVLSKGVICSVRHRLPGHKQMKLKGIMNNPYLATTRYSGFLPVTAAF